MAKIIGATSIDSGSSSLKSVDGNYLSNGDLSLVLSENGVFFYKLYDEDESSENIPYIVKPSENAASKRWRMLSITELSENIRLQKDNNFQLTNIKLGEENKIVIYDYSGNEIGKITNSQFNFNNKLYSEDFYPDRINDKNSSMLIFSDGSTDFTSPIISPDPEYAGHLTNKNYVDTKTASVSGDLEEYKDYVDDNFARWDNTESHSPSHDYNPTTKKYVDDEIDSAKSTLNSDFTYSVSNGGTIKLHNPGDINFSSNLSVQDDGDNTVTITVPNDLTQLGNYNTDDLSEGDLNLYYADWRVDNEIDNYLSGGVAIVYDSGILDLDLGSLTSTTSISGASNYICFYDANTDDHRIITPEDLILSVGEYTSVSDNGTEVVSDASNINFSNNINVTDDGDGTVTVTVSNDLTVMSNYNTDDLSEGTGNLYFTTGRVDDHLSGGTGINYDTGTISLSANLNDIDDVDASSPSNEQVLTYIDSTGNWEPRDASGGGSGLPQIFPSICSLDDVNTGSSRGNVFGMVETIDFASSEDGSIWFTMHFPSSLDASSDITLDVIYNLSGADDSTSVDIQTDYWVYGDGTTPDSGTPDGTNNDSISTGTGEESSRRSYSLTNIPSTALTAGYTITLKITRLGSSDNYSGTFQLLYLIPSVAG